LDMPTTRVEVEMCGSRGIRRKIQSTPVSDMGVINVTYKCKITVYIDIRMTASTRHNSTPVA
jgi:hypothetical protein